MALTLALLAAVILTGFSAGFFATYEYSVTRALAGVDDTNYVATFQAINSTIRSGEFGVIFFGSLVAQSAALIVALSQFSSRKVTAYLLLCAFLAYAATLFITFTIHIPLNNALAVVDIKNVDSAIRGREMFESRWNNFHRLRTATVGISFVLAAFAMVFSRCSYRTVTSRSVID